METNRGNYVIGQKCDHCLLRNLVTLGATVCPRSSGRESRGRKLAFRCCPSPESCAIKKRYYQSILIECYPLLGKFYYLLDYGIIVKKIDYMVLINRLILTYTRYRILKI